MEELECPACRGPLRSRGDLDFACSQCGADHAALGGIACLLRDRGYWIDQWRRRLSLLVNEGARTITMFEAQARRPGLLESTRARLLEQAQIAGSVLAEIAGHLRPAIGAPILDAGAPDPFIPLDTLHFLHRDWGWPERDENERALALVRRVLPSNLGRMLVLGCGAARMTYDLHREGAGSTWGLDIDPFVLLLAQRVLAGDEVVLTEGRANATELERLAVVRHLRLAGPPAPEIRLLLADGLDPPFADGSFDTVVTPWFIDVVPDDLREFLPRVRRLLAPEGTWINFGPLLYPASRPAALRYSREELFDLCARIGLPIETWVAEEIPFAHSPLTERGRVESCLAMRARRSDAEVAVDRGPPSWLVFPSLPVPHLPAQAEAPRTAVARRVAASIDGRRSIDDLAEELAIHLPGRPRETVKDAVRQCLADLFGIGS